MSTGKVFPRATFKTAKRGDKISFPDRPTAVLTRREAPATKRFRTKQPACNLLFAHVSVARSPPGGNPVAPFHFAMSLLHGDFESFGLELGEGSYGTVWRGKRRADGNDVSIKMARRHGDLCDAMMWKQFAKHSF